MRNLKEVVQHLHKNGKAEDFNAEGLPTVAAVRKLLGKPVTRDEIDQMWFDLYWYSTCRE